jgi:pimeloyl-ACP methyl ester carboxylesterase
MGLSSYPVPRTCCNAPIVIRRAAPRPAPGSRFSVPDPRPPVQIVPTTRTPTFDQPHSRGHRLPTPGYRPPQPAPPIDADILRIPVGPGALHVERYGHGGRPVLVLHGFGTCAFLWRAVGPSLALSGCTAFAVDLMGHGESDRPFGAGVGIAAQAVYLDRALTALRIARATVAGVDLGAAVALRLAAAFPERVERLSLINPLAFECVPAEDVRTLQRNTARFALRVARGVLGAAPLLTPILEGSVADSERMPMRLVARYLAPFVGREGVGHLLDLARSVRAADVESIELAAVHCPTLLVRGEADRWVDATVAARLAAALPDARLLTFPEVGRLVPEERPEEFATLLADFANDSLAPDLGRPPARDGDGSAAASGTTGDSTGIVTSDTVEVPDPAAADAGGIARKA